MPEKYRKHFIPLESNPDVFNELLRALGVSEEVTFEDVFTLDDPDLLLRPALAAILPVIWFRQTINNACGLYAVLHALSNGQSRRFIKCIPVGPEERARILEDSTELEEAYAAVARKGDSAVPENAEDEVDYHYICFVPSAQNGQLYELDGDCKGPTLRAFNIGADGAVLGPEGIAAIKTYVCEGQGNIGFNLMALVRRS
ncbi:putative ubiquitin carboxyl-terminal hydrolase 1 [Podospora australis]|uniref:ubiquitinyl hydrolase 1 n=1 Tax=Podospora australis TaxID=1536484 RepID=A0AAN6WV53_9PEZI|nr:putative ubiquitin carboxyl-terminal hydrolase 1 [Podospora australis]